MADKKWYNLFVSVDQPAEGAVPVPAEGDTSPAAELERLARGTAPKPASASTAGPAARPGAAAIPATPKSVAQIASTVGEPKFNAAPAPNISFEDIYSMAEIRPPAHGYTIQKVSEMLQSEHLRGLAPEVKRSSVLVALEAAGVKIDEVIQDAVRRDRALDAFERAQEKGLSDLEARKDKENRQIQAELDRLIAEHQAKIQANTDEVARQRDRLYGWRLKKQQEEQKIADAVGYFLSPNPISTTAPEEKKA